MNNIKLSEYGFCPDYLAALPEGTAVGVTGSIDTLPARITAVHKERYAIVCTHGETYSRLKTREYYTQSAVFPTVGDFVLIRHNPDGDSLIVATLPRRTYFSRRDPTPGRGEQAVAANFDYVFIMQSLNHDFNAHRLERYLTLAWQSGAQPVILLTKVDAVDSPGDIADYELRAAAVSGDCPIHAVSAHTGAGLDALAGYFAPGKTAVFLGSSGVGKSSLVNALAGEEIMAVNGIREDDSRGRHTTTHRQLIMLRGGAMIIDTPGMRELGMWDVSEGLGSAFADVEHFLGRCRFSDCAHQSEPGCAVKAAIASGELSAERWESYRALRSEAKYADDPESYRRRKDDFFKGIKKNEKKKKKEIW